MPGAPYMPNGVAYPYALPKTLENIMSLLRFGLSCLVGRKDHPSNEDPAILHQPLAVRFRISLDLCAVHLAVEDYRTGATATPTNESAQP